MEIIVSGIAVIIAATCLVAVIRSDVKESTDQTESSK